MDQMPEKKINSCPMTPNCVSSVDTDRHFIHPLRFSGSTTDAQFRMLRILNEFDRVRIVTFVKNFIQAEFISSVFRFVDDVEFYFDDHEKIVHVKSASRVGFSDLGVNRRRIEMIRKRFEKKERSDQQ